MHIVIGWGLRAPPQALEPALNTPRSLWPKANCINSRGLALEARPLIRIGRRGRPEVFPVAYTAFNQAIETYQQAYAKNARFPDSRSASLKLEPNIIR